MPNNGIQSESAVLPVLPTWKEISLQLENNIGGSSATNGTSPFSACFVHHSRAAMGIVRFESDPPRKLGLENIISVNNS